MSTRIETADCIEFLGKLSEALRNLPSSKTNYGDFYVKEVVVTFDGTFDGTENIGKFVADGNAYSFEFGSGDE